MIATKRPFIPIMLILAVLSVATYLLTVSDDEDPTRTMMSERLRSAPDISLEGVRQTFIEKGRKQWQFKADSARLSRSGQQTRVNDIEAVFFTADGRSFQVTADGGVVSLDSKDAEISGNVIIRYQDYKIYTQSLRYRAEDHIITADNQVRLISDSLHLTGDRLRYDLVAMRGELTGNVNGLISENLARQ